jgi:hypothetical protein
VKKQRKGAVCKKGDPKQQNKYLLIFFHVGVTVRSFVMFVLVGCWSINLHPVLVSCNVWRVVCFLYIRHYASLLVGLLAGAVDAELEAEVDDAAETEEGTAADGAPPAPAPAPAPRVEGMVPLLVISDWKKFESASV